MVTIAPLQQDFGWKAHGEDIAQNLNAGFKIYYTVDGKEPNAGTTAYKAPFKMDKGELKAVSVLNDMTGEVLHERLGFIQQDWKLSGVSSDDPKHAASFAFDANPDTYWMSKAGTMPRFIAIDLGKSQSLTGFAYTPQKQDAQGMMAKGIVKVSDDGQTWKTAESFEFGNLINDPTKRFHYFKKPVTARFVQVEATEIAANGTVVTVAELNFF